MASPPAALEHLRRRGVLDPDRVEQVVALDGGVSSTVFAVTTRDGAAYVVKRALAVLKVPQFWAADPRRSVAEATALSWYGGVTPEHVPEVVDIDHDALVLVTRRAPLDWRDWRTRLLTEPVEAPGPAHGLGEVLAAWHRTAATEPELARAWQRPDDFRALRTDPYFRRLDGGVDPATAQALAAVADELDTPGSTLVHGDFSPKNILVGAAPDAFWVIDAEVTHWGHPAFDVAFLCCHLAMKAAHRPAFAPVFAGLARAFLRGYGTHDESTVRRYTGALLLARVHGRSQAAYLGTGERDVVRRLGHRWLRGEATWDEGWAQLSREGRE